MDEDKTACCGRPLMLIGQYEAARKLIEFNREQILGSKASKLVVSCPICYKVFKEDYGLPTRIKIQHHSEFLLDLIYENLVPVKKLPFQAIYHDPCELGRGTGIYHQPRLLLDEYVELISIKKEKEKSLCCGGSLANIKIQSNERNQITNRALSEYLPFAPDILLTSCPLCKKTFSKNGEIQVLDIAEIIRIALDFEKTNQLKMN
jgi:Fe-S oxidoreductase